MTTTLSSTATGETAPVPTADTPADRDATGSPVASSPTEPQLEDVPVPADQAGIDVLRTEIDSLDAEILRLIKRRNAVSHAIGAARRTLGGPRIVYSREMAILERFRDLGPAGADLGMLLLSMGRGRLGRK
nr:chorismate mutase [Nakamurella flava]